MDHRYGRHGPRAWLKWRTRHAVSSETLPILTARTTVYVYNLSSKERIIYIVMDDANQVEASTDPQIQVIQASAQNGNELKYLPPPDEIELKNSATNKAASDVAEIKRRNGNGKIVRIDWNLVEERADRYARAHVKDTLVQEEYRRRIERYVQLYHAFLEKFLDEDKAIRYIGNQEQSQLRDYANKDRDIYSSEKTLYIRDIAVIRVLQVTHLSAEQGLASLMILHALTDFYQECYTSPREEVSWPPETFLYE